MYFHIIRYLSKFVYVLKIKLSTNAICPFAYMKFFKTRLN